jgi:parvulin-like peptidyl-prolyl isomerase
MKSIITALVAAALLVPAAWAASVLIVEEIIAKVNGDIVTRSEYERVLHDGLGEIERNKEMPEDQKAQRKADQERNALRDLVDQRLLIQRGKDLSVSVEAQVLRQRDQLMKDFKLDTIEDFDRFVIEKTGMAVEDFLDQMRNNYLTQHVIGQEVSSRIVIPRADVEKYYEEHKAEFINKESVQLREIFFTKEGKTGEALEEAKTNAETILARVKRGEPFDVLAKRHSENKITAEVGGDIGRYERGQLTKEIEDTVFDQRRGFITDLIDLPTGWLIIKLDEKFAEGQASLDDVQDEIRGRLSQPKWPPAIREYLSELREEAYIEIRPGYTDSGAIPGMDTSWSDPAKLAPVTTTKEEVLSKGKKRRLLWLIPLPGGGGDKEKDADAAEEPAPEPAATGSAGGSEQ